MYQSGETQVKKSYLRLPTYNIDVLSIPFTFIDNHIKQCYNFCFNHQISLEKSRGEGKSVLHTCILPVDLLT